MIKRIDILGVTGTPMRVLLVPAGEQRPNHPDAKVVNEALVEFYDGRYNHTPDGQFIAEYYVSTVLKDNASLRNFGLDLMGYTISFPGLPEWKINARTVGMVYDWLVYHVR